MIKDTNPSQTKPSKIAILFWLLLAIFLVCSWAVKLSPAPQIKSLPAWSDLLIDRVGWSAGLITLALIWFTKPGHRFLTENSKGKLARQAYLFFSMPIFVGILALLTTYGAISGLGGLYVSIRGEALVDTGEIVSKSYTGSRGCRYRTDIRWSGHSGIEKHCYSEELWSQIKIGQTVSQKRWQLNNVYAQSHFAWPNSEIPAEVRQAEIFNAWRGFFFLGGYFIHSYLWRYSDLVVLDQINQWLSCKFSLLKQFGQLVSKQIYIKRCSPALSPPSVT